MYIPNDNTNQKVAINMQKKTKRKNPSILFKKAN